MRNAHFQLSSSKAKGIHFRNAQFALYSNKANENNFLPSEEDMQSDEK